MHGSALLAIWVVVVAWFVDSTPATRVAGVVACVAATVAFLAVRRRDERVAEELRRATSGLAKSEERFRIMVRDSADITIVTDENGTLRFASPAAKSMLGYDPEELIGSNVVELLHPDDVGLALEGMADLAVEGQVYPLTVRVRRADGSYADVETIGANQLDNPAIGGLVITVRDVSERNRALAQLAEAEERFEGAFEHAPIGMGLADVDGVIVRANHALGRLLGRTPEELRGLHVSEITHPDDRARTTQEMHQLLTGRSESYRLEKRYLRSDGTVVWTSMSATLVRDAQGEPRYTIAQMEDVTERRALVQRLEHQAIHDPLTGLPNRTLFLDRIGIALERTKRSHAGVAVIFLDLDQFKRVNDGLGHMAGDELLTTVARRLQRAVRPTDTVARFGGDEFTILCEDVVDEASARRATGRLIAALEQPAQISGGEVFVTASIGIAMSGEGSTADTLLRDADTAMYRAKESGRAAVEVFVPGSHDRVVDSLRTSSGLHRALERREFELHYQPIVEVRTQCVRGFEALLRWRHPERGLVAPSEFIALAEECGLIGQLGLWVLDEACHQMSKWQRGCAGGERLSISVNLSTRQLADPTLPDQVAEVIDKSGMAPDDVWLEITESALVHDAESAVDALRALHAVGVHLSVDDFGTGYSSLSYLKRFPVEALKIDRSFVRGLGHDPEDTAIVTAVVSLAHALGLTAIAEGVETHVQHAELLTLGCDFAQGFLFGHPRSAGALDGRVPDTLEAW